MKLRGMLKTTAKFATINFGGGWMGQGGRKDNGAGDGQSGGGGNSGNQNNGSGNNSGNSNGSGNASDQNNNDNNNGNNDDLVTTIFNEDTTGGGNNNSQGNNGNGNNGDNGNGNGNNGNGNQGGGNQQTPEQQVTAFLSGVGLGDLTLTEAEIAAMQSGEGVQAVIGRINQRIQHGFVQALTQTHTLIDKRIKTALEEANTNSRQLYASQQVREAMHEAIPASRDGHFGPVVETIVQQFLSKSSREKPVTLEKAIDLTKQYFQRLGEKMGGTFGDGNNQQNGNGANTNIGGNFRGSQQKTGNTNWLNTLRGK